MPTRDGEDPVQATTEETERVETTFTRRRWQNSLTVGCVVRVSWESREQRKQKLQVIYMFRTTTLFTNEELVQRFVNRQ